MRRRVAAALLFVSLAACQRSPSLPRVDLLRVPAADEGGGPALAPLEGRVTGARAGQHVVIYAKSGAWWVQPFTDRPFSELAPDGRFENSTHLGTHYAALLVEPGYRPAASLASLPAPGDGVVALALVPGAPAFWHTWWFRLTAVLALAGAALAFYRYRVLEVSRHLNVRFEERLGERTRIAQELHDTLLQGFLSVAMHLDVVIQKTPEGSPSKSELERIASLVSRVVEDGRNAVRGLRSTDLAAEGLEKALAQIRLELPGPEETELRVVAEGPRRELVRTVQEDVYRIGREAVVNAFRHSGAPLIEVEVEYAPAHLRLLVRDGGRGVDPALLEAGREGHFGLSGMRERAERASATLRIWSAAGAGTEVEVKVPAARAYAPTSGATGWRRFLRARP